MKDSSGTAVVDANNEKDVAVSDHSASDNTDGPPQLELGVTLQSVLAIISLMVVYNAYLFTLLMPGVVLSQINADVGPHPSFPWITIVWNLSAAVIVTIGGRITDLYGRRNFMMFGAVTSMVGCLIGALGKSVPQMIVAGVFMGFGGGFQEIIFASVQEVVPNKKRLLALGALESSNIIGKFSPLIAVAYVQRSSLSWRACYWHGFACEGAAVVALYFWYKPPSFETKHKYDGKTRIGLLKELVYVGLFLFTLGCVLLLMALNWGGRSYPWKSAGVIAPIVLSVVVFVALGFWETYYPLKYPILPVSMFKSRQFNAILAVVFIGGMLYYSCNVLWPRQATALFVPPGNPIIAGVYSNIFNFGTITSMVLVLGVVPFVGHEKWQMVILLVIQTALIGSMGSVGVTDKAQAIVTIMLISCCVAPVNFLAFGMSSLALNDQTDLGVSQGLLSTTRLIGGAIATAIYNAIQTNKYAELFAPKVTEAAQDSGFTGQIPALLVAARNGTAAAYNSVPGITSQTILAARGAIKQASAESFQLVYLVALAFGAVAVLAAFTTKNIPKSKKTNARAVALENEVIPETAKV